MGNWKPFVQTGACRGMLWSQDQCMGMQCDACVIHACKSVRMYVCMPASASHTTISATCPTTCAPPPSPPISKLIDVCQHLLSCNESVCPAVPGHGCAIIAQPKLTDSSRLPKTPASFGSRAAVNAAAVPWSCPAHTTTRSLAEGLHGGGAWSTTTSRMGPAPHQGWATHQGWALE